MNHVQAQLHGLGVAMVTPFNNQGMVDFPALQKLVELQQEHGTGFLVALGTTGETPTLSLDERRRVVDFVLEVNADGCLLLWESQATIPMSCVIALQRGLTMELLDFWWLRRLTTSHNKLVWLRTSKPSQMPLKACDVVQCAFANGVKHVGGNDSDIGQTSQHPWHQRSKRRLEPNRQHIGGQT